MSDMVINMKDNRRINEITNAIIGSAEHEGYVDDGFVRPLIEKVLSGELSLEEAKTIVLKERLNKKQHRD